MSTSPKLHFLKYKDGRFLNIKEKQLYASFVNATYDKNNLNMKEMLKFDSYKDFSVHTLTEDDFIHEMSKFTSETVIVGAYFHQLLMKFSFRLPTISQVNKDLYVKSKQLVSKLIPLSRMKDSFLEQDENETDEYSGHFEEFITEMAKINVYECAEVTAMLKARSFDRSSMSGMTRKILKLNGVNVIKM